MVEVLLCLSYNQEESATIMMIMKMMMKTTKMMKMIVVQVAEKERAQRLLEIYNRMDARSHVVHEGKKFKKSDILQVGKCQRKGQRLNLPGTLFQKTTMDKNNITGGSKAVV